ncbi:MAG: ankyrin repeat domain-containing protein [Alphaproteobacteria bacterium]|nr:MAG: ankyrin repeat domain-containing protein [Alphaproteobacteria bacterium]
MTAAKEGDSKLIWTFLKEFGKSRIDSKDSHGDTALTLAARFNQVAVVRMLLEAGAGVDVRDGHRGTALMAAAVPGNIDVIRELLAQGADVTKKSYAHKTALWYAEVNNHPEAAALIADAPRLRAEKAARITAETAGSLTGGLEKPLVVLKPLKLSIH